MLRTAVRPASDCANGRFFDRTGPHTLSHIATVVGGAPPERDLVVCGVAPLQTAGPAEISFLDNAKYVAALESTRAGAVIVHPNMKGRVPDTATPVFTSNPYAGWARAAALFHPMRPVRPGIHASAVISHSAIIDPSAEIGPLVVVEDGAQIGAGCRVGPGAIIGANVIIGSDCRIGAHASVSHASVGARVYIYPGARIGQEGFGFASTETGFLSVPQLGSVIIGDDVEVGANTTIDRGSARDTVIGAGSRLDNLVQIGHNVVLGRCCVVVAQVGISGSTEIEDFVRIGGQAGIAGHLHVGRGAQIGAQAGLISDVPENGKVLGTPAQPRTEFFRQVALLKKMMRRGH